MTMLKAVALFALALQSQVFAATDALEVDKPVSIRNHVSILPPAVLASSSSLNTDLDGPLPTTSPQPSQLNSAPADPTPQYIYESWDVLRQYPRAAPLTPPAAQAFKPSDTPKTSKESKDAQRTTTPQ